MGYIENAIGAPVASVEDLLFVVGNLTNGDDDRAKIDDALRSQLSRIASTHGGKVPLHGRLFAQWLHYAFPRECPFPHKTGTAAARTPMQFGESFAVSQDEVSQHLAQDAVKKDLNAVEMNVSTEKWQMSQWSEEEELPGDYSVQLAEPWWTKRSLMAGGGIVIVALAFFSWTNSEPTKPARGLSTSSHFV